MRAHFSITQILVVPIILSVLAGSLTVTAAAPIPTLTFTGQSPTVTGGDARLSWDPVNVTRCVATANNGAIGWAVGPNSSPAAQAALTKPDFTWITPPAGVTVYSLECWNADNVSTGKHDVDIIVPPSAIVATLDHTNWITSDGHPTFFGTSNAAELYVDVFQLRNGKEVSVVGTGKFPVVNGHWSHATAESLPDLIPGAYILKVRNAVGNALLATGTLTVTEPTLAQTQTNMSMTDTPLGDQLKNLTDSQIIGLLLLTKKIVLDGDIPNFADVSYLIDEDVELEIVDILEPISDEILTILQEKVPELYVTMQSVIHPDEVPVIPDSFAMYQDGKLIPKRDTVPLYILDKSKGTVTYKWNVKNVEGCRMTSGYSVNKVGIGPTSNMLDTDDYWMPAVGEKTMPLSKSESDLGLGQGTTKGFIYYTQLRCGPKSKRWTEYSSTSPLDLNFIEVKDIVPIVVDDIPDAPFITSSNPFTGNVTEIYPLRWNQVPGMEYYIAFDGGNSAPPAIVGSSSGIALSRFTAGSSHTVEIKACKVGTPAGAAKCSSRSIVKLDIKAGTNQVTNNSLNGCDSTKTEITLSNGQTWACKNVGASVVGTGVESFGGLYKFGNDNDLKAISDSAFILAPKTLVYWQSPNDRGPCPTGFRIPTKNDWLSALSSFGTTRQEKYKMMSALMLPAAGYRAFSNGGVTYSTTNDIGDYWTNTVSSGIPQYLDFDTPTVNSMADSSGHFNSEFAMPIRCIKGVSASQNDNSVVNSTPNSCKGGNRFNFGSDPAKQCVGVMPTGNINDRKIVNAEPGFGYGVATAKVTCGLTGWSVVESNCTNDKSVTNETTTGINPSGTQDSYTYKWSCNISGNGTIVINTQACTAANVNAVSNGCTCTATKTSGGDTTGNNSLTSVGNTLKCSLNGINDYIQGDVRCVDKKQVRCENGQFQPRNSCSSDQICEEKATRTSNGNFFTSCKDNSIILSTTTGRSDSMSVGFVKQDEIDKLKTFANYKCFYNPSTKMYGNCQFQSCYIGYQKLEKGGDFNCISNTDVNTSLDISTTTSTVSSGGTIAIKYDIGSAYTHCTSYVVHSGATYRTISLPSNSGDIYDIFSLNTNLYKTGGVFHKIIDNTDIKQVGVTCGSINRNYNPPSISKEINITVTNNSTASSTSTPTVDPAPTVEGKFHLSSEYISLGTNANPGLNVRAGDSVDVKVNNAGGAANCALKLGDQVISTTVGIPTNITTSGNYKYTCTNSKGTKSVEFYIQLPPKIVWTDSNGTPKTTFYEGEVIKGYIEGGDPANTWYCLDKGGDIPDCPDKYSYRKLTSDEWNLNPKTGRLEYKGIATRGMNFSKGLYTGNVSTGQNGSPTETSFSFITLSQDEMNETFTGIYLHNSLDTDRYLAIAKYLNQYINLGHTRDQIFDQAAIAFAVAIKWENPTIDKLNEFHANIENYYKGLCDNHTLTCSK